MPQSVTESETEARAAAAATGTVVSLHAKRSPERAAIVSPHGSRTYAALDGAANRVARALRAAGLAPGDAIALVCRNRPEFAEVHQAAARSGLRLTPVNWHLTGGEMSYIVADCDAKAIVADVTFADAVSEAVAGNDTLLVKLAVGGPVDGFTAYDDCVAGVDAGALEQPVLGRSMLYTSGTTGRPKGVDRQPQPLAQS